MKLPANLAGADPASSANSHDGGLAGPLSSRPLGVERMNY